MRRREFIALGAASMLVGGTALAPAAWAQQSPGRKRLGYLNSGGNPDGSLPAVGLEQLDALRAGLKDEGFVDGTNVIVDIRLGRNDPGVIRAEAHDLAGGG